ncbi:MAG: hypothetical protein CL431_07350 [Acidimicrobiaceae bacterium]|jgi:regulator of ribonuclease activity A|nr:hypothetical protein [Acidimicrobiaceae bacterium]|tara:strand:+ start:23158 stop:23646 length:489 start_codon:yes stop_codon:yes gene_type:complete
MQSFSTADLLDNHPDSIVLMEDFLSFGKIKSFFGRTKTIHAPEDNSLVRQVLKTKGNNQVLVVDGCASRACALIGDQLALLAIKNEWAGIIVNGYIRDSAVISEMPIGIKALGTNPRKSVKKNRGEIDIELNISQIAIKPGLWIYSDPDGIIIAKENLLIAE